MPKPSNTKKRKYYASAASGGSSFFHSKHRNPKRGPPGMLLTCETGRETKCQREGLEILMHYYNGRDGNEDNDSANTADSSQVPPTVDSKPLSLEEELKQLQQSNKNKKKNKNSNDQTDPLQVYDTGCRGTVFLVCTLPDSQLIEPILTEYKKSKQREDDDDTSVKNSKIETPSSPSWDPIATFQAIWKDRIAPPTTATSEAPSSRFVTRMIPVQATCFASPEELSLTAAALLKRHFAMGEETSTTAKTTTTTKTFAITAKRRNCQNLPREKIIDVVAAVMEEQETSNRKLKVDLSNPDITIVVEVCKTLCGVSVVENALQYKNFNLLAADEAAACDDDDVDGDDDDAKDKNEGSNVPETKENM